MMLTIAGITLEAEEPALYNLQHEPVPDAQGYPRPWSISGGWYAARATDAEGRRYVVLWEPLTEYDPGTDQARTGYNLQHPFTLIGMNGNQVYTVYQGQAAGSNDGITQWFDC